MKNTYTIAVFDCCRGRTKKNERDRGIDSEESKEPETGNLKIIFGCGPGEAVATDSRLSLNIEEEVRRHVEAHGGVFKTLDNKRLKCMDKKICTRDDVC